MTLEGKQTKESKGRRKDNEMYSGLHVVVSLNRLLDAWTLQSYLAHFKQVVYLGIQIQIRYIGGDFNF